MARSVPGGPAAFRAAVLVAVAGLVAGAVLTALVWTALTPADRDAVVAALDAQVPAVVVTALALATGLGLLVGRLVAAYTRALRLLAADLRLLDADPAHPVAVSGPDDVRGVAAAAGALAERRRAAEHEVDAQVAAAAARLAQERNRLAALMAELAVAVVVCNADGRVLLYNSAARSLVDDDTALGLGRSVFATVDRGLVEHALDRVAAGHTSAATGTTLLGDRVLQVRVAVVAGDAERASGFVLLLEDVTDRTLAEDRRLEVLRTLTEGVRDALGTVVACAEAARLPGADPVARAGMLERVVAEARGLGERLDGCEADPLPFTAADEPLAEVRAGDLVRLVASTAARDAGLAVATAPPEGDLPLRVEGHALVRALAQLALRVAERLGGTALRLSAHGEGGYARVELAWTGRPASPAEVRGWAAEPVAGGAVPSLAQTLARHGGELWPRRDGEAGGALVVLVPVAEPLPRPRVPGAATVAPGSGAESRPEFYDFDLFDRREPGGDLTDSPLAELAFTVFDTETTGLLPTEGDEVVALGAVRVVNGRLLRSECFERLVDPRRSVPEVSTAVHGLTREMLAGRPTLDLVLPEFARFAADTVLVGHNVGFDLQFLRLKEDAAGVRLQQPVLDTLLLDAVAHPDHDGHSLEAIATRFGIDVVDRHSALGDAVVTAEVLLRLVALLDRRGIRTLGEALEASRRTLQSRLDQRMYGG